MKRNVDHGLGRFGGQSLPTVRTGKPIVDRGASVVGFKLQTKPSDHATATRDGPGWVPVPVPDDPLGDEALGLRPGKRLWNKRQVARPLGIAGVAQHVVHIVERERP